MALRGDDKATLTSICKLCTLCSQITVVTSSYIESVLKWLLQKCFVPGPLTERCPGPTGWLKSQGNQFTIIENLVWKGQGNYRKFS